MQNHFNYNVNMGSLEIRKAKQTDNLNEIAKLIYLTDPYIYPYWFNKNNLEMLFQAKLKNWLMICKKIHKKKNKKHNMTKNTDLSVFFLLPHHFEFIIKPIFTILPIFFHVFIKFANKISVFSIILSKNFFHILIVIFSFYLNIVSSNN